MSNQDEEQEQPSVVDRRSAFGGKGHSSHGRLPAEHDVEKLKKELEDEKKKAETFLANWQRAAADFQNYKRRTDQERQETAQFANAALIMNILPVLDDLERALTNVDTNLAGLTWIDGIRFIYRKFQVILEAAGVKPIESEGKDFDPRYHEATMSAEGEEGKVIAEVQRGYLLGERVIRPAMVVVGNGSEAREGRPHEGGPGSED